LKEKEGILALDLALGKQLLLWALFFALGFLVWEVFGREMIAEGKKISKGEFLERLMESLH
jgi:hypothetical protein